MLSGNTLVAAYRLKWLHKGIGCANRKDTLAELYTLAYILFTSLEPTLGATSFAACSEPFSRSFSSGRVDEPFW